jgi:predicted ATPase
MKQIFKKPGLRPMPKDISHVPLYRMIWKEVYWKNSNFILINSGKPGKGKSTLSIALGWDFDRKANGGHRFGFETHLAPTAKYFIDLINVKNQPKGTVRILDESSIMSGANAREFQTFENKLMSSITQIMRHRNQLIIFNSPNKGYIDRQVRDLAHGQIYATGHDNYFTYGKFVFLDDNMFSDTVFTIYPRYLNANGELVIADKVKVFKPPQDLMNEYESAMDKIKQNWEAEYKAEFEELSKKTNFTEKKKNIVELQKIVLENSKSCLDDEGVFEKALIEETLNKNDISISIRDLDKLGKILNYKLKKGMIDV